MSTIATLEKMLANGQDNALLRFGLGNAYLRQDQPEIAVEHLAKAVTLDPGYSAAWKLYGKALAATGRVEEAIAAYEAGIKVAETRGDIQAAKEMKVFLRRLQRGG